MFLIDSSCILSVNCPKCPVIRLVHHPLVLQGCSGHSCIVDICLQSYSRAPGSALYSLSPWLAISNHVLLTMACCLVLNPHSTGQTAHSSFKYSLSPLSSCLSVFFYVSLWWESWVLLTFFFKLMDAIFTICVISGFSSREDFDWHNFIRDC